VLEDRERYRMLKYLYVSPATFLVLLIGRGGARLAAGAMGTVVALVFAVIVLGLRIDLATVDWALLVACLVLGLVPIIALGVLLAAVCLQTRQESWSYPDAFAGAMFLVSGVVFPLAVLPPVLQVVGLINPITWWIAGPARDPAGRAVVDRWRRVGVDSCHRYFRARWSRDPDCLVRDRGAGYTRGHRHLPIERASGQGPRAAGSDDRLIAAGASARGGRRRSEGELMRIYEGSPRQDFEEVFRSIGSFLDTRGMRDLLLVEVPDGFVVQGLVAAGSSASAWSESVGSIVKETLSFFDDDIAKFMEEAAARRGGEQPGATEAGAHERALRVIGHWIDTQKPKDVFLFEQDGAYVVRLLEGGQAGAHHTISEFAREDIDTLIEQVPTCATSRRG
jgi:hypothetical protein